MPIKKIFGISADTLEQFEEAARLASGCGATHLIVTENLPPAQWQFDAPSDPYPAWYAFHPGLLKTFPPAEILPFVDEAHAHQVVEILRMRCEILRRHNLHGAYFTTEPQVLPEEVFAAHPHWRGPRVDQPNRSRRARFAPCVGHPDVGRLYAESMQKLVRDCPEIDTFLFLTIDSGSGFCWSPSLYPGANGCASCSPGDVGDRALKFLKLLAESARQAGQEIELDLTEIEPRSWMRRTFSKSDKLAAGLPAGLAINNREGPGGHRFASGRFESLFFNAFYPVVGLPRPVAFLRKLIEERESGSKRVLIGFNDGLNTELNVAIFKAFRDHPVSSPLDAMRLLYVVAGDQFGPTSADAVLRMWLAIDDVEKQLASLDFGPFLFMGGLLARWITRPFVPFPEELEAEERKSFFPYLFQARNETAALNIIDIQAMRMFEGWGARLLVEQAVEAALRHLEQAQRAAESLQEHDVSTVQARLRLLECLLRNGRNAVAYQAQLDRLKAGMPAEEPVPPPPIGASASWDCLDLANIARAEIDNTVQILSLVRNHGRMIIDMAPEGIPESIMRFSSQLPEHLQTRIRTMNAKWEDYSRLAQPANP